MKFKTIYADPPWYFNDKLDPTRHKPYSTLTVEELKDLPIEEISDTQAHLYLWSPNVLLREALEVMDSWGYTYKTYIVWLKITARGKLWFGMGHYFRASTEILLFGVRGSLKTRSKSLRNLIIAKKPSYHSGKPLEAYDLIEEASYPPRLELFSRNVREGWECIGYDVDGMDIRESIRRYIE